MFGNGYGLGATPKKQKVRVIRQKCPPTTASGGVANQWPGMTRDTSRQFTRVMKGIGVDRPNQFAQVTQRYYHIVDYPTTGATLFTFFNVNASEHVCNLPNGTLPDERPFALVGLSVAWLDFTAAGVRSGVQLSVAATTPFTRAEEVRTILQGGLIQVRVADRLVLDAKDLTQFPQDGGFFCPAAYELGAATAGAAPFVNGMPISGNYFKFRAPYAVLPGKKVDVQIKYPSSLTVTTAGALKVTLIGEAVTPLNN